jgi:hypothetical protein
MKPTAKPVKKGKLNATKLEKKMTLEKKLPLTRVLV